jgi:hypothetical protein
MMTSAKMRWYQVRTDWSPLGYEGLKNTIPKMYISIFGAFGVLRRCSHPYNEQNGGHRNIRVLY